MIARVLLLAVLLVHLACRATAQSDPQNAPANRVGYGGGAYRVGGGVSAPKALYAPDPEYSEEARKAKYQGTVVLWLVVDANGRPQQIRIQRALGMGLDEKAIEAVKMWKFEPARKDGQPVPVMINVNVTFRLYALSPHPDSAGQPPRFPGVNTSKYPLVVRLNAISFSGSGAARTAGYQAAITDAGQERQVTISCILASSHCLVLADGTYPARWEENMKSLEILGLSWGGHGEWKKTEYTVKLEEPAAPGGVTQPTAGAAAADRQKSVTSGNIEVLSDTQGVDFGPYLSHVVDVVRRNWYTVMPFQAKAPVLESGNVSIEFVILRDGHVGGMKVTVPSGDIGLDRAAWGAITGSAPFAPLPEQFRGPYLALRFRFQYNPKKTASNDPSENDAH